jgi:hypothetical protein
MYKIHFYEVFIINDTIIIIQVLEEIVGEHKNNTF